MPDAAGLDRKALIRQAYEKWRRRAKLPPQILFYENWLEFTELPVQQVISPNGVVKSSYTEAAGAGFAKKPQRPSPGMAAHRKRRIREAEKIWRLEQIHLQNERRVQKTRCLMSIRANIKPVLFHHRQKHFMKMVKKGHCAFIDALKIFRNELYEQLTEIRLPNRAKVEMMLKDDEMLAHYILVHII